MDLRLGLDAMLKRCSTRSQRLTASSACTWPHLQVCRVGYRHECAEVAELGRLAAAGVTADSFWSWQAESLNASLLARRDSSSSVSFNVADPTGSGTESLTLFGEESSHRQQQQADTIASGVASHKRHGQARRRRCAMDRAGVADLSLHRQMGHPLCRLRPLAICCASLVTSPLVEASQRCIRPQLMCPSCLDSAFQRCSTVVA